MSGVTSAPELERDEAQAPQLSLWKRATGAFFGSAVSAVIVGLILLLVIFTILNGEAFASAVNFRNIALDASVILILAVGSTFVIITAGIDLSIGSVLVFSGVVAAKVMIALGGMSLGVALIGLAAALASGMAWGALNGWLIAKARLNPIIVTLGSLGGALGLAHVLASGQDIVDVPTAMTDFGNGRLFGVPNLVYVAIIVTIVGGIVLHKTVFGRYTYAVGSSDEAAKRAGLPVGRHLVAIYTVSGFTAGLAGWLSLARFSTTGLAGHGLDNLNAITAVLLGGTSLFGGVGTMLGTLFGALIPTVLANGLVIADVQSYWQQAVTGAVLVAAVYIDRVRREHNEG